MAALAVTVIGDRLPQGRYVEQTVRVTTTASSTTEWISKESLSMREIVTCFGNIVNGTAVAAELAFTKNAQGFAATEGDNPGDLGVQTTGAEDVEVTVRGFAL